MVTVVVDRVKVSAWPYSLWMRMLGGDGLGGLVVRVLTQNVRGMWFDSHPKLHFSQQSGYFIENKIFFIRFKHLRTTLVGGRCFLTHKMAMVVVDRVRVSAWPYSLWMRVLGGDGLGGLVVRVLTQNVRGMWFDSHPKLHFSQQSECFIENKIFFIRFKHLRTTLVGGRCFLTHKMATVVVDRVKVSAWPYSLWMRVLGGDGLGGLVVRVLTQNVRGMWFDSHPKLHFSQQSGYFIENKIFFIRFKHLRTTLVGGRCFLTHKMAMVVVDRVRVSAWPYSPLDEGAWMRWPQWFGG